MEENLEPVVTGPEVFNQWLGIGETSSGTSPGTSDLEEVQSSHEGEITPVVLRSQRRGFGNDGPSEETPTKETPTKETPAEEPPAEEHEDQEPLLEEFPAYEIPDE